MISYGAVILGGGESPTEVSLPKGNIIFNGRSLAGHVYEAARKGFDFDRVALVMDTDNKINLRPGDIYVQPTFFKGAWLSAYRGIKALDNYPTGYILIAGDLPFFDEHLMKKFMTEVERNAHAGIIVPLVPRAVNEQAFPQRKRTYQPLQEGDFLAGNFGYISGEALLLNEHFVDDVVSSYQQKLRFIFRTISYFGLHAVLRSHHPKLPLVNSLPFYDKLFPKFSINELEEITSTFTGVGVKFVEFPYPESAFDIDTIGQLELAHDISHSTLEARVG